MKSQLSPPVVVTVIVLVVLVAGLVLFKAMRGGTQGDGKVGNVQAMPSPPGGAALPGANGGR